MMRYSSLLFLFLFFYYARHPLLYRLLHTLFMVVGSILILFGVCECNTQNCTTLSMFRIVVFSAWVHGCDVPAGVFDTRPSVFGGYFVLFVVMCGYVISAGRLYNHVRAGCCLLLLLRVLRYHHDACRHLMAASPSKKNKRAQVEPHAYLRAGRARKNNPR